MKNETLKRIVVKIIGPHSFVSDIERMVRTEDSSFYDAWRIQCGDSEYLLKKTESPKEEAFYRRAAGKSKAIAAYAGGISYYGKRYILMEFFRGHEMCKCTRDDLILALDALISLQDLYWVGSATNGTDDLPVFGTSIQEEIESILRRREYLQDPLLERTLDEHVARFPTIPRTLCHNDLLPFNILVGEKGAVLIDWEYYGILPYPMPLARLIAHTKPDPSWDFTMSVEDKEFAISYYYDHLIKSKGISYDVYRHSLDYFLFYELTEWIYVCRKYKAHQPQRLEMGLKGAIEIAQKLHDG